MLSDNEYVEFEDRKYLNPQVALGESDAFIDNLRSTQQANNQQIQTDTYNLGTEIPSDLGGLTGGEGYFAARYSTPQTASAVSSLRAAAQATALNQVLADEQAKWKNRYQQAYRNYQNRQYNNSRSGGSNLGNAGNGGNDTKNVSTWSGEPKVVSTDLDESEITNIADTITNQTIPNKTIPNQTIPPNPYSEQFNIDGEEQTQRVSERSGLPEWLVNILKIMP